MSQLEDNEVLDLDNAIKTIDEYTFGTWNTAVTYALDTILQSTRNLDRREYLNNRRTLSKITQLFAAVSEETTGYDTEGRLKLMRCVGNLIADNGTSEFSINQFQQPVPLTTTIKTRIEH